MFESCDDFTNARVSTREARGHDRDGAGATGREQRPANDGAGAPIAAEGQEIHALGFRFHPMTAPQLLDEIMHAAQSGRRLIVGGANLHGLYVSMIDEEYDRLLRRPETITILDGMPLVWLLKALGHGVGRGHRTTWVDWFEKLLRRAAEEGRSVFILGHTDEVLGQGLDKARAILPELKIDGLCGFFDIGENSPEARAVVEKINAFRPDILILGMGMPRQEAFASRFGDTLDASVIGLGGAAFSYFAGAEPTPPRWMGRWGLEWAHRLLVDPRRLAWRYLVEPQLLAFFLARRALGRH